ncbi:autotransporter domain-containing protein [Aurantiacibacter xanthus]|uniref:Autotransporter domain-containing protein n=1 Tax=Aurantiacibacter xanthus TaxID=1784712 RepID=A0A3A1P194_9SPHN|nr:autotransporter domain-containing protein [Aurantiacibacter xanthus]RIV81374.1 autotransporter domain-containing protein [Aurantiacibacter xanthus]
MRNFLFVSTAMIALATPALAEDIGTARTTPARTSTIANGAPGAITITDKGSITLTTGTAVTMDSNHAVTNAGAIKITGANGAAGIVAQAGTNGAIVNSGTITIDEDYTPTDTDKDGDLDGPFALGSNRFGIRIDGAHTGKVENSGKIIVEGNNSAGIWIAGPLDGAFTHTGATSVLGDGSTAIRTDAITGDVRLAGTVTAQGKDAVAAQFTGDITGAMVVQGSVSATGYRYPTAPSDPSKLDADDLLQGGSALLVEGNVTGGIVIAAKPKDAKDGEVAGSVIGYGAAPAMVIGAQGRDVAIGPVGSTASKFGLQIDGAVRGAGVYAGVDANGLQIGGRGGAVSVANGISVAGGVTAVSLGANATALRLGAGATTPVLQVSGTVQATGADAANEYARALRIDAGASLPTLRNSGTIKAAANGENGNATAISDASGTLALIENAGRIEASGAKAGSTRNIAIDLSANTGGATVRQTVVGNGYDAPTIVGDIRFGSGNDVLDLADGSMVGSVYFGSGSGEMTLSGKASHKGNAYFAGTADDALALSGSSVFDGRADFGGGAGTLTLAGSSRFSGSLANAGNLAVTVTGGTLDLTAPSAMGSLDMAKDGRLVATLDKTAGQGSLYDIAGTASFAKGAKLELRLASIDDAEGRYEVLRAGTLQGASDLELGEALMPFLFKATLASNAPANTLAVDVSRRSIEELGLTGARASAYNAVFAALGKDEDIEDFFMGVTKGEVFRAALGQLLPEHSGGAFEGISMGTRILARQASESVGPTYSLGGVDLIFNAAVWTGSKDEANTASYDVDGMGYSVAAELDTEKLGTVGVSLAYLYTTFDQGSDLSRAQSDTIELAAYWRGKWGGFSAFGRGSYGFVDIGGTRTFQIGSGTTAKKRESRGDWGGNVTTLSGGASYESGGWLYVRPAVWADFTKLSEDGYTETGGGKGMDLIVEERDSDEFAVNGSVAVGIDFYGKGPRDSSWLRVEGEGGWREVVGGTLGATTARFDGGEAFTIAADQQSSGWFARARAVGGSEVFEFGGEVGAEERFDKTAFSLKGTLRIGL